mmetsp:Transcript_120696/g.341295  ORF Transcript_120696/g.341295 Transcript_120696/m.341295 type:complete len:307 (+) Transcript_120696:62-982(+)
MAVASEPVAESGAALDATEGAVPEPADAAERRAAKPVVCYRVDLLPRYDAAMYQRARRDMRKQGQVLVPPREARTFEVPAGHFFRIVSVDGPQVGDLNLWNLDNLRERFYTSKTRQLHATHLSTGDRLWTSFPWMRPMATITHDTLAWYGWDEDGAGIHDVIGSRCDPYTNFVLRGENYDHCCHSNLTRSLVERGVPDAESHVHDVLNVFMCTGFTKDTKQYFMKASPVRPGDFIEFFAEINLLGSLSACPGGDCAASHSSDSSSGYPLLVEVYRPVEGSLEGWERPKPSGYSGGHGILQKKRRLE